MDSVAHHSLRPRSYCATRAAALVLVAGCAVSFTTLLGGVALADPPPPSPSLSSTPEPSHSTPAPPTRLPAAQRLDLALSTTRGTPGTEFTATVSEAHVCDQFRTAVAESGDTPIDVTFDWRFGQKTVTTHSDSASVTFTVPENATAGTYQVVASCTGPGTANDAATFTVTAKPSLSLSPQQGTPRARVTATTTGFDACLGGGGSSSSQTMSWRWDGAPLPTSAAGGDASTVSFDVPADALPSDAHTVTAACGDTIASAPFTVNPIVTPTLRLDKGQGTRGSQLTASGTGFACDDGVTLLWDGKTSLTDSPSGTFSVQLTVPADASVSQHTVVASCRNHPDITDSQSFMVTNDTVGVAVPATLGLAPARGVPGDRVHVTGDRFACGDSRIVELLWDGQRLANSSADASGHFDTSISVPPDAQVSSHIVRASCVTGSAIATAGFTVIATGPIPPTIPETTPPPPPSPQGGTTGFLVLAIVGVLAALAVLAYRHWRKPRPNPKPRVYATVSPTSGLPLVSTRETPAHGEVTHALRLQVHADPGTQTISEVDSDYTTQ
jgi:hypothetical protein